MFHNACGRFCAGVPASVVIRDQILTLSSSRSQRQYWTVGNRPIRKNDLRSLHRNSVEAQIQDRSRQKTGLNTVPGFSRVSPSFPRTTPSFPRTTPSFPRTREPSKNKAHRQTSPSRSEGDACAARRGCPKFTTPVIPADYPVIPASHPSFPRTREPSKNKAHRQTSPSRSEGDACAARRGCPKTTNTAPSKLRAPRQRLHHPPTPSVIPASHPSFPRTTPSFPQAIRHSRGRGNPEKNKAHRQTSPFAERRGRVRSTQGMPENHQHRPFEAPNTKTTPPSSPHPLRHSRKPYVIPASPSVIPPPPPSFPQALRHSRGRGNPEKNKARHFHPNPQHPSINATTVPSPASNHPSPSQGETKRGSLVRAQGGAGHPSFHATTHLRHSPQYPEPQTQPPIIRHHSKSFAS